MIRNLRISDFGKAALLICGFCAGTLAVIQALVPVAYATEIANLRLQKDQTKESIASPNISKNRVSYETQVKPILERRCVVCHGCYDAPCQLKLSSIEGLRRGATKEKVYEQRRLTEAKPSRLFIDANGTSEWRSRNFHAIINEGVQYPATNLENSVLYRILKLKQRHPLPQAGKLPDDFTLELDREQECPDTKTFDSFAKKHPQWGMPYATPNLSTQEFRTLEQWLARGAKTPPAPEPSAQGIRQQQQWERFLNQLSNKTRLVSRYLYEHLFHAHIHFANTPAREFYRLVRSTTPAGKPVDEIATVRPYDDPGAAPFYYRLLRYHPGIVAKNHIVYELSDTRMERFRELFIEPDYTVDKLPSYDAALASNPFKTFTAIPAQSRYRFLLDEARFFIEGFIKGPVCRGQIALNVIEDHFWVLFFNPDKNVFTNDPRFIATMADDLQLPTDEKSSLDLLSIWTDYWQREKRYMETKQIYFENMQSHTLEHALGYIWNGDDTNPNAALTIFRHFDSASVNFGLVGSNPETTWIIDYPLLERIHYLLVAGFNIYGNVVHQLKTRIYMDFLRMEGEDHFLVFLPAEQRKAIRDSWYIGLRTTQKKFFQAPEAWLEVKSVSGYKTTDPQKELYQKIEYRLSKLNRLGKNRNRCGADTCPPATTRELQTRVNHSMARLAKMKGSMLEAFPEVVFVRVRAPNPDNDLSYSLIRNTAYKNVTSFLADERQRDRQDIENDTLTVVNWLEGSYPNFFFDINASEVDAFVERCANIRSHKNYEKFVEAYGIRRTHPEFWATADWFQDRFARERPVLSGLFDLNRYQNR